MAKLVFDIESSALPLERFDEAQQEYLFRECSRLADELLAGPWAQPQSPRTPITITTSALLARVIECCSLWDGRRARRNRCTARAVVSLKYREWMAHDSRAGRDGSATLRRASPAAAIYHTLFRQRSRQDFTHPLYFGLPAGAPVACRACRIGKV